MKCGGKPLEPGTLILPKGGRQAILSAATPAGFRQPRVLRAKRAQRCRAARSDGLICRNEMLLAVADQIRTAHALQRLAQHGPIVRIVIAQKSLVQGAYLGALGDHHLFARTAYALEGILG